LVDAGVDQRQTGWRLPISDGVIDVALAAYELWVGPSRNDGQSVLELVVLAVRVAAPEGVAMAERPPRVATTRARSAMLRTRKCLLDVLRRFIMFSCPRHSLPVGHTLWPPAVRSKVPYRNMYSNVLQP
jgi:hypothetical protein